MSDNIYGMNETLKVIRAELERQEQYLEDHPERYRLEAEKVIRADLQRSGAAEAPPTQRRPPRQ